ncbi:MAG: hypothetical protein IH957_11530 [Chloroflexi bacterium]|nr:hypothetical protein [Chloroflexota bacterium]
MPTGSSIDSADPASGDDTIAARAAQTSVVEHPQWTSRRHTTTHIAGLVALTLPATGLAVTAEAAFIGYIFVLVDTLGFPVGLATFIVTEAVVGVAVLAFIVFTWPRLKSAIESAMDKPLLSWLRLHHVRTIASGGVLVATVIAAIVAALLLGLPAAEDVAAGVAVFAIILALLAGSRWMGERLRRFAEAGSVTQRSLAIAALMVVIGPFGGVLYRTLVTRLDHAFALTVASAALFGIFWVPFYYYGVLSLVS